MSHLVKETDVIRQMLKTVIENLYGRLSDERIREITRILARICSGYSVSNFSNRSFSASIVSILYSGISIQSSLSERMYLKGSTFAGALGVYGYVQIASNAAVRLKQKNYFLYHAFYSLELEMLYFLIESAVSSALDSLNKAETDDEIARQIEDLIR